MLNKSCTSAPLSPFRSGIAHARRRPRTSLSWLATPAPDALNSVRNEVVARRKRAARKHREPIARRQAFAFIPAHRDEIEEARIDQRGKRAGRRHPRHLARLRNLPHSGCYRLARSLVVELHHFVEHAPRWLRKQLVAMPHGWRGKHIANRPLPLRGRSVPCISMVETPCQALAGLRPLALPEAAARSLFGAMAHATSRSRPLIKRPIVRRP